eukprot:scaffold7412_cov115-Cylindrotheca_fusiformis.AAC.1
MPSRSNNAAPLKSLLRILGRRRSSPSPKSKKEASSFLFRAFFFSKKTSSHQKPPKKTRKNLKKMMRKLRQTSSSEGSSIPALALADTFETGSMSSSSSHHLRRLSISSSIESSSPSNSSLSSSDQLSYLSPTAKSPSNQTSNEGESSMLSPPSKDPDSKSPINDATTLQGQQTRVSFSDIVDVIEAPSTTVYDDKFGTDACSDNQNLLPHAAASKTTEKESSMLSPSPMKPSAKSSSNDATTLHGQNGRVSFSDIVEVIDVPTAYRFDDDDDGNDKAKSDPCYGSFEEELFSASKETLEKFPELQQQPEQEQSILVHPSDQHQPTSAPSKFDMNDEPLQIDCSDSTSSSEQEVDTSPSSTMASDGGESADWSVGSVSPLAQCVKLLATVTSSQDIFRPAMNSLTNNAFHWDEDEDEHSLAVQFNPSFDGIEMVRSFDHKLEPIEEEPATFEMDDSFMDSSDEDSAELVFQNRQLVASRILLAMVVLFLFAANEAGVPLTNVVGPKLVAMITSSKARPSPVVPSSLFKTHHTPVGAWLK